MCRARNGATTADLFGTSLLAAAVLAAAPAAALAKTIVVKSGKSIQDAVDAASPGDTIRVKAGVYTGLSGDDSVVTVRKDDLTLIGMPGAVIDATGFEYGIMVGEDAPIRPAGCPPITVDGFTIEGFTVRNADDTGLRLVGVRDYRITGGSYLDNFEYGPFPVCSRDGYIAHNFASGHRDAAIYVGDDDGVLVESNVVVRSVIGIEVENTVNAVVRDNFLTNNTVAILVVVLPGLPMPFTENVQIRNNVVFANNFPNPVTSGSVALLPTGTGILNLGADRVLVDGNLIALNDSLGLGIIGNPFALLDTRIEPFADLNEVRNNVIVANGANPDPLRALTPGADIVFIPDVIDLDTGMVVLPDPDPTDNCFEGNAFFVDFPPGIVDFFPCPSVTEPRILNADAHGGF